MSARFMIDKFRWPFWRGETGAAWEFHGSDGSAGEPRLSSQLCRCGLAFIVVLRVAHPSHRGAPWCNGATARRRLRVLRVTCNAGDVRCRPWSTTMRRQTGIQSAIDGFICHALGPVVENRGDGRDQRDKINKPELAVELAEWQRCPA